jgi:hypothetical protein
MTNINTALSLSPQARLVLSMLEHKGSVTLAEAHEVYRVQGSSLAGRVRELRNHGLRITSDFRRDQTGKRYVRYFYHQNGVN